MIRPGPARIERRPVLHEDEGRETVVPTLIKAQEPKLNPTPANWLDWLRKAATPIAFARRSTTPAPRRRVQIAAIQPSHLPYDAPGSGVLALFKNAPHPKAAQLFLNWIMTREGMQLYQDLEGMPVTRTDVDRSTLLVPETVPKPGVTYFDTADYNYVTTESRKLFGKLKGLLKR